MNVYKEKEDVVKVEFIKKVNEKIVEKIGNNENTLDVDIIKVERLSDKQLKTRAIDMYIRGLEIPLNTYANYSIDDLSNCYDMLYDETVNLDELVEKEANNYIDNNKYQICENLLYYNKMNYYMRLLDDNNNYVILRKLNSIFLNKHLKTLNIKYKKDDKEMDFQMRNNGIFLRQLNDIIPYTKINRINSRLEFERMFRHELGYIAIYPKFIEEISCKDILLYTK